MGVEEKEPHLLKIHGQGWGDEWVVVQMPQAKRRDTSEEIGKVPNMNPLVSSSCGVRICPIPVHQ
jgi:hypothetical protein